MQSNKADPAIAADSGGLTKAARAGRPDLDPDRGYLAFLGGSATVGKSVTAPFPSLVATATGLQAVNLGVLNGGPDAYLSDRSALHLISRAEMAVVQLTGAEALSNPYYSVHARRNDRFLAATPALRMLYPDVDFTEIHFTRHLLQVLARTDPERFALVVDGLQATWVTRMQSLLVHLPLRRRLLWLADGPPPVQADDFATAPLFVNCSMLDCLCPLAGEVIVANPSPDALCRDAASSPDTEATGLPGPAAHREIADLLAPVVMAQLRRPPLILDRAMAVP
jgi:Domain of unknown function (DUF6473)